MKSSPFTKILALCLGLSVANISPLGSFSAQAATFYWDTNGNSTAAAAATGTWGTSNFWSTDPTGATATSAQTIDNTSDVVFAAGSNSTGGTVTISGTQAAHSITFDDPVVFTLNGGTAINLGSATAGSGIFVTANAAQNVNTPVILNSAATAIAISNSGTGLLTVNTLTGAATTGTQTVTIGSSNTGGILVGGTISNGAAGGNVALTINNTSTGVTTLQGNNSYTGGTTITAGTAALTNNSTGFGTGTVAIGASGTANITLTADGNIANVFTGTGTITVAGSTGTPTFSNASGLNGFTGTLNVNTTGAKKVTVGTASEKIGSGATVNITSGGTLYLNTSTASNDGVTFNVVGSGNTENLGAIRIETNSVIGATSSVVLGGNTSLGSNSGTGTINAIISESTTSAVTKVGAGTLVLGGANAYTGATTIGTSGSAASGGTLTVSGASGSIAGSSDYTINGSGSQLNLDYSGGAGPATLSRLNDSSSAAVTLNLGGELRFTNGTNATNTSETFGTLTLGTGAGIVSVNQGGTGGAVNTITSAGFARGSNFATGLIRGTNIGAQNNTNRGELKLTSTAGLTQVGTSTSATGVSTGTVKTLTIVPYLIGDNSATGTGTNFVTYDTTSGFRLLGTNEQTTLTTGYTTAASHENVIAGTNITLTNASGIAVNSLLFNATSALNSTNSNALTVDSGAILDANVAASIGSGFSKLTLGNGEGVISVTGNTLTINTPVDVTSSGGLTKTGAGTVVLTAANLYTGATTINQGTLTVGNGTTGSLASGSGAVTVVGGATLALNQPTTSTFANDVANAGTFNITNNGTQTLSGNITGAGGGNFSTIAAGKTLILSGTANTYSNGTSLTGTLQFNAGSTSGVSGASSANSAITMNSGATLQLRGDNDATFNTGTITMPSDISSGSDTTSFNFDVGQASVAGSNKTLTLGTLTFNTGTSGNRGNDVQTINLTGTTGYTLAITNAIGANSNGQVGQNYQYNVASGLTLSVGGGLNSGIGGSHIFQGAGNTIVGTLTKVTNRAFNVFVNGTGTVTFNNAANNGGGSNPFGTGFNSGTTVFNDVSAVAGVQINLGNQTAASTADVNFLLGGSTGLNGGLSFGSTVRPYDTTSGLLTIGGQNTSNTNTFSAGIQLGNTTNTGKSVNLVAAAGGTVIFSNTIANNGADTTAGITINGAYTVNGATVNPSGTVSLTGANTFRGDINVNGGTLVANRSNNTTNPTNSALGNPQVARNINVNNGGTLQFAAGDTFGGNTTSVVSTLVINDGGTVTNANNVFTTFGAVQLNGGTLTGTGGAVAAFQMYSLQGTVTVGGTSASTISGSGTNAGYHLSANTTFNVADATGDANSDLNVSGVLIDRQNSLGAGALTKSGTGTMTLSGANTYTGATTISGGTLQLGDGTSGNDGTIGGSLSIVDNANLTYNRFGSSSYGGTISGSGTVTKLGAGTQILTGTNTYTGATTISLGTLQIGSGGTSGSISGTSGVTNDATLAYNRSDPLTVAYSISGSGAVNQIGSGTTTFTGSNSYSGITTIASGALQVGAGGTTGTLGSGNVVDNASLVFNRSDSVLVNNLISGSGTLTQAGGGVTTLGNSANSYAGITTINSGTLSVGYLADGGAVSAIGSSSNAAANLVINGGTLKYTGNGNTTNRLMTIGVAGATFDASGVGAITFSNIAGAAAFVGSGNRTVTLTGAYVNIVNPNSFGPALGDGPGGATSLVKSGVGTWVIPTANSFSGGTTLSGGVLAVMDNGALGTGAVTFNGSGATLSSIGTHSLSNAISTALGSGAIGGNSDLALNGVISGGNGMVINNTGITTYANTNAYNTYTGSTTINSGATLRSEAEGSLHTTSGITVNNGGTLIDAASGSIGTLANSGTAASLELAGGKLEVQNTVTEYIGTLTLTDNSTIDFGTGSGHLNFADGSYTAGTLSILNWSGSTSGGGTDQLHFATSLGGTFVNNISFTDPLGFAAGTYGAQEISFGGGFEIVPISAVPEPSTVIGALLLAGFVGYRERRRMRDIFSRMNLELRKSGKGKNSVACS